MKIISRLMAGGLVAWVFTGSAAMGLAADISQDLLDKVQQEGTVHVIVKLSGTYSAEGNLSSTAAVTDQRARIATAQEGQLSRLTDGEVSDVKRFTTIPFMAMAVDETALDELKNDENVLHIQEDHLHAPALSESVPLINADDARRWGADGSGYVVAVLDSGVRKSHEFIGESKVVSEACYSSTDSYYGSTTLCPNGNSSQTGSGSGVNCSTSIDGCSHGTHVAGIVTGKGSDPEFGVAPGANIISIQIYSRFDSPTYCGSSSPCILSYDSDQILGLERVYALRKTYKIAAVNLSLGGGDYDDSDECDSDYSSTKDAIDNLRSAGIATIVSAGNDGYDGYITAPACISTAIAVGATLDDSNEIADYSNHSSLIDLLAPGSNITSSVATCDTCYESVSGTSMAAPHVAGAFAMVKSRYSDMSVAEILSFLQDNGVSLTRKGVTRSRINLLPLADSDGTPGVVAPFVPLLLKK